MARDSDRSMHLVDFYQLDKLASNLLLSASYPGAAGRRTTQTDFHMKEKRR
jgi:hypothetical protein